MAWQAIIIFWRITYMSSGIISGTMLRSKNIRKWNLLHDNTFSEVFRWKLELFFNDNRHFYHVFPHFTAYHQLEKSVNVFTWLEKFSNNLPLTTKRKSVVSKWRLNFNYTKNYSLKLTLQELTNRTSSKEASNIYGIRSMN